MLYGKAFLRSCQLCSAPFPLRTVSQGILLTNSLQSWNFSFLKFRVLTLCLTHIPQDCKVQRFVITAAQADPNLDVPEWFTCVGDHQIQYCIPSGRAITRLRKSSSLHSRSLLDFLQLTVLLSQMLQLLKFPSRTRAHEHDSLCSWSREGFVNRLPSNSKKPNKICNAAPLP